MSAKATSMNEGYPYVQVNECIYVMEGGTYEWDITHTRGYCRTSVRSPYFTVSDRETAKWYLTISFGTAKMHAESKVEIKLHLETSFTYPLYLIYYLYINSEELCARKEIMHKGSHTSFELNYASFDKYSKSDKKSLLFVKIAEEGAYFYDVGTPPTSVATDMYQLLRKGRFCDTVIRSIEPKRFHVHKVVLAARSRVLAEALEAAETNGGKTALQLYFDTPTVEEFIRFLYTTMIDFPKEDQSMVPWDLLKLARFYEIESLEVYCKAYIVKRLSPNNVEVYLLVAWKNEYETLKEQILRYMVRNRMSFEDLKLFTLSSGLEEATE